MKIPPTRDHRQLAAWINASRLKSETGRPVRARVEPSYTNTDRMLGRLRRPGRGRRGLKLAILEHDDIHRVLFEHDQSQTYRRHAEAREWIERNLRRSK